MDGSYEAAAAEEEEDDDEEAPSGSGSGSSAAPLPALDLPTSTQSFAAKRRTLELRAEQEGRDVAKYEQPITFHGCDPDVMGIGPAVAIPVALEAAGVGIDDIDSFEINEAFAAQAVYCVKKLGVPESKLNPLGGAIALGHPLGMTGSRQIATLLHHLRRTGGKTGVVSMCIGTGMGAAAVFEAE